MRWSFSTNFRFFQFFLAAILLFSGYLIYDLYQASSKLRQLEANRFVLVSKADELRQSSDYLTSFARQYVVTAEEKYRQQFEHVLAIRNGELARPDHYEAIYWDLVEPIRQQRHGQGVIKALHDEIHALPYSEREMMFLDQAEANSNALVAIEVEAFKALRASQIAKKQGRLDDYQRLHDKAIGLVFSDQYLLAKHDIMLPIDEFLVSLSLRLEGEIQAQESHKNSLAKSLPILLGFNLVLILGAFRFMRQRMDSYHQELKDLSIFDFLTQAHNRRYAFDHGKRILAQAQRDKKQIAVLLLDIDFFKKINDEFGHQMGDQVLKQLSKVVRARIRSTDIFARYGGEEFMLILPNIEQQHAREFAEHIRLLLGQNEVLYQARTLSYSASIGVAMSQAGDDLKGLISKADKALYQAKENGRNQVVMFEANEAPKPNDKKVRKLREEKWV